MKEANFVVSIVGWIRVTHDSVTGNNVGGLVVVAPPERKYRLLNGCLWCDGEG
jgi:hypothetical protein